MQTEKISEKRNFRPNQNLIFHLIEAQNSSPVSAIKELVQNSYDAKSEKVEMIFDQNKFEIIDNGKGFLNREEIENFFEEFGKEHTENNSQKFGRFRMGRCQIMGFASTVWRSGYFSMIVDIKNKGLVYDLIEHEEYFKGCKITANFYNNCWYSKSNIQNQEFKQDLEKDYLNSLIKDLKYIQGCDIYINKDKINVDLNTQDIDFEDENFVFIMNKNNTSESLKRKRNNTNQIEIYNLGIYTNFEHFYLSGTVITKKHLKLDISRNYIDKNCQILLSIFEKIKKNFPQDKVKNKLSSDERISYFYEVFSNYEQRNNNPNLEFAEYIFKDISKILLFTSTVKTKAYTLQNLLEKKYTIIDFHPYEKDKIIADKLTQSNLLNVICPKELNIAFGLHIGKRNSNRSANHDYTSEQIFSYFLKCIKNEKDQNEINKIVHNFIEFEIASERISSKEIKKEIINDKDLSKFELAAIKSIRTAHNYITSLNGANSKKNVRHITYYYPKKNIELLKTVSSREILVGEATNDIYAWTDGKSFICINRSFLNTLKKGKNAIINIALVLAHEYSHTKDSLIHNELFYKIYHDLTCDSQWILSSLISTIQSALKYNLIKLNIKVPKNLIDSHEFNALQNSYKYLDDRFKNYKEEIISFITELIETNQLPKRYLDLTLKEAYESKKKHDLLIYGFVSKILCRPEDEIDFEI